MSLHHQRRRGATILFRRKIPSDLRDRFGCSEIVRSLGRATPGEARRLVNRLWSQTELVFMRARTEPSLSRDQIIQVVSAAVDGFRDDVEDTIAEVRPDVPLPRLDEPENLAHRMAGLEALIGSLIERNDMSAVAGMTQSWVRSSLGKDIAAGSHDERRTGRAILKGLAQEARAAAVEFNDLAKRRETSSPEILDEFECAADETDLAVLQQAKIGDNVSETLERFRRIDEPSSPPTRPAHAPQQQANEAGCFNAGRPMSELWPEFCDNKVVMKEWKPNEAVAAKSTLKLWLQVCGDHVPAAYSSLDVSRFHKVYRELPNNYYHNKAFKQIYEARGVVALAEDTKGLPLKRTSDKTWNSHNSPLHGFFEWCAGKGKALAAGTPSICKDEFVFVPKLKKRKKDDHQRRIYKASEIVTLFSANKFNGARSERLWKQPGHLVFRDHRYWVPLMIALHGNRREEAVVLSVKHVKQTSAGLWYFHWSAPELADLLKDTGSPRDVPIHNVFLDLGFIEARVQGRDPEARLFPEAISYGKMERNAEPLGKWWGLFCDHCGITDPALDLHAWRHTVVTLLGRAAVPPSQIEELVGHESEQRRSELATYDHGSTMDLLKAAIDKLELPIDVAALKAAVARSDPIERSAAWPNLADPDIVPKPKASNGKPSHK